METIQENRPETADAEIVQQVLSGSTAEFEQLMRKYNQRLYRVGMSYLKEEKDVEDAMQNTYLKAFQGLNGFANEAKFSTWLTRIMINECLQLLRKKYQTRELPFSDDLAERSYTSETVESALVRKEISLFLEETLQRLPQQYRAVFMLREIEGMSTADAADVLEISESNVKTRLHRAKEMLRQALLEKYGEINIYEFGSERCNRLVQRVLEKIMG